MEDEYFMQKGKIHVTSHVEGGKIVHKYSGRGLHDSVISMPFNRLRESLEPFIESYLRDLQSSRKCLRTRFGEVPEDLEELKLTFEFQYPQVHSPIRDE